MEEEGRKVVHRNRLEDCETPEELHDYIVRLQQEIERLREENKKLKREYNELDAMMYNYVRHELKLEEHEKRAPVIKLPK